MAPAVVDGFLHALAVQVASGGQVYFPGLVVPYVVALFQGQAAQAGELLSVAGILPAFAEHREVV
jgi:hypothetical protein